MHGITQVFKERAVQWKGQAFKVTRPNFDTELAYEIFLQNRALESVLRNRQKMGEEPFREALAAHQRDCASGEYSWGSWTSAKSTVSPICFRELLWMICSQSNPHIEREEWEAVWRDCREQLQQAYEFVMGPDPTTKPPKEEGASRSPSSTSAPS